MRARIPQSMVRAFTLIEVLVSVSVLAVMMTIVADMMMRTQDTISRASAHATEFQEARRVLDALGSALSQSTMDAVWEYRRTGADAQAPNGYQRVSDHHFILGPGRELLAGMEDAGPPEAGQAVFFQAPLGKSAEDGRQRLHELLNCCGFYVRYATDEPSRPDFLNSGQGKRLNPERMRFRLMQYVQPAEESILYSNKEGWNLNKLGSKAQAMKWYQKDLEKNSIPLGDNILALVLTPHATRTAGGATQVVPDAEYRYDSRDFQWNGVTADNKSRRHQLPVMVGITLVVADEKGYQALVDRMGNPAVEEAVRGVMQGKFTRYGQLKTDLEAVEKALSALPLHHKILSSTVPLRGSKWISDDEL